MLRLQDLLRRLETLGQLIKNREIIMPTGFKRPSRPTAKARSASGIAKFWKEKHGVAITLSDVQNLLKDVNSNSVQNISTDELLVNTPEGAYPEYKAMTTIAANVKKTLEAMLATMIEADPEAKKAAREEASKKAIIEDYIKDGNRFIQMGQHWDSYERNSYEAAQRNKQLGSVLVKWAQTIAPTLSYDELFMNSIDYKKVDIKSESSEYISAHSRTSTWSTTLVGKIPLGDNVYEVKTYEQSEPTRL